MHYARCISTVIVPDVAAVKGTKPARLQNAALIVAYTQNRVIGNQGRIPWEIKGEQKRFKELTTGNIVIMGRKSYEEIGRPLPNRFTIVVSSTMHYEEENCVTVPSLMDALHLAKTFHKDVFISGGARLYREAISLVDKMYITHIEAVIEGDTYFPEFDQAKMKTMVKVI